MKKKIKDTQYVFVSALVRAREGRLADREKAERMLDAPTLQDAAAVAEECGYEALTPLSSETLEASLGARRAALFAELHELSPAPEVVDFFRLKYDYHNAKVVIKATAARTDADRLLSATGRVPGAKLLEAYEKRDYTTLPEALGRAMSEADGIIARTGDPQTADFALDKACYFEMLAMAGAAGSKFLMGYARLSVDGANLGAVVRSLRMGKGMEFIAKALIPGGEVGINGIEDAVRAGRGVETVFTGPLSAAAEAGRAAVEENGSLTAMERLCDRALDDYLAGARLVAFGEQPLISYICAVENEIRTIRAVLGGRLAGLSADVIRERLRESDGR